MLEILLMVIVLSSLFVIYLLSELLNNVKRVNSRLFDVYKELEWIEKSMQDIRDNEKCKRMFLTPIEIQDIDDRVLEKLKK